MKPNSDTPERKAYLQGAYNALYVLILLGLMWWCFYLWSHARYDTHSWPALVVLSTISIFAWWRWVHRGRRSN